MKKKVLFLNFFTRNTWRWRRFVWKTLLFTIKTKTGT